jgi:hypothetical protein
MMIWVAIGTLLVWPARSGEVANSTRYEKFRLDHVTGKESEIAHPA